MTPKQSDQIEAFIPQLRRYARSLVRNPAGADDLVQDCLERAVTRLDQFQTGTNMRAWLFTIMHSIFVNQWRQNERRGTEVGLEDWTDGNFCNPSQESELAVQDTLRALAALPKDSQAILQLIGVEGFSYQEAAEILEVPLGTVRSRLSRAREMLRHELTEMDGKRQRSIRPSLSLISQRPTRAA